MPISKYGCVCTCLLVVLWVNPTVGQEQRPQYEQRQSEMLKVLFKLPRSRWRAVLRNHITLLDGSFFQRVDARIAWDRENHQVDDEQRFALVGDLACEVVGRPQHYRENPPRYDRNGVEIRSPRLTTRPKLGAQRERAASYLSIADMQARDNRREFAEYYYQLAAEAAPDLPSPRLQLGILYYRWGKTRQALTEIRRALVLDPKNVKGWRCLGECYLSEYAERPDEGIRLQALQAFHKALRLAPGDAQTRQSLTRLPAGRAVHPVDLSTDIRWHLRDNVGGKYELGGWLPEPTLQEVALSRWIRGRWDNSAETFMDIQVSVYEPTQLRQVGRGVLAAWGQDHQPACLQSQEPGVELRCRGRLIGRIGESVRLWKKSLGKPRSEFATPDETIWFYRAAQTDIGVGVESGLVRSVTLAEPGTLQKYLNFPNDEPQAGKRHMPTCSATQLAF